MPQKLARGFQLIFWGLVFWIVDISLTVYFTTDSIKVDILPDIAGVFLIFLGSLFLQNRHFSGTIGKRYRFVAIALATTSFLWLLYSTLIFFSAEHIWDKFARIDFFWVENIFFTALIFVGFYTCKFYGLKTKAYWIRLGIMMTAFYISLFVFGLALRDMLHTGPPVTVILLALYSVYTLFALFKTKRALL